MKRRVVVSLLTSKQDFQLAQATAARETGRRANLEVEVLFAENNGVTQIHQLFQFISAPEGVRPLAIVAETVSGEGFERVARNAVRAGIGWVLMNRDAAYVDTLRAERGDLPIANVSVDNEDAGRIQGRQLRILLPKGGRVLYVQGPADTAAARQRFHGARQAVRGSRIELEVLSGNWTEAGGERAVSAWLDLKRAEDVPPAVVCAQNDSMAVGARSAVQERRSGWTDLVFTGCDGLPEGGQRLVRDGKLAATIVTPPPAGPAVTLVARALAGEPAPAKLLLPPRSFPSEEELARHAQRPATR